MLLLLLLHGRAGRTSSILVFGHWYTSRIHCEQVWLTETPVEQPYTDKSVFAVIQDRLDRVALGKTILPKGIFATGGHLMCLL